MKTTVVNVKSSDFDVYIGRANARRGFPASPYANPFRIGPDGGREDVIGKYRAWLAAKPELVERAKRELAGKRLGCWCKEKNREVDCHGDVLAEICNGRMESDMAHTQER